MKLNIIISKSLSFPFWPSNNETCFHSYSSPILAFHMTKFQFQANSTEKICILKSQLHDIVFYMKIFRQISPELVVEAILRRFSTLQHHSVIHVVPVPPETRFSFEFISSCQRRLHGFINKLNSFPQLEENRRQRVKKASKIVKNVLKASQISSN
jgi:hypothetical protein